MDIDYKKICESLLKGLPRRTSDVVEKRFGLKGGEGQTLEAIGGGYDITRERVRQIAEEGFSKIRPRLKEHQKALQYFNGVLKSFGGLKREDILLSFLGGEKFQNQVSFLLNLDGDFKRVAEDKDFYSFWARKKEAANLAPKVVGAAVSNFEGVKQPLTLDKLFSNIKTDLAGIFGRKVNKNVFNSYLEISKKIQANTEGKIGLKNWVEINPRGIKDKAYLVLKKEQKPLHFSQVAILIGNSPFALQKKVHVATVHNELIKDQRFVLVGRGLYALKEWGYQPGVVKDVISGVLKEAKTPLSREEIIEKVSAQRLVKENTISLNLRDQNYFIRGADGRYKINPVQEA